MYGENQAEYGNGVEGNETPVMNEKYFSVADPMEMILGGMKIKDIMEQYRFQFGEFAPYIPPKAEDLRAKGVQVHYLGYYLKWDPQECYYYAVENTGFSANTERTEGSYSKYSSIDDKIDPFHYYTTLVKFGIGRATYDAAQEIRNGKITREEGVQLVRKYDPEFPAKYFSEFLGYIETTPEQFCTTIDAGRSPHLWENAGSGWVLKHAVWH
jgi:hypothetical protein